MQAPSPQVARPTAVMLCAGVVLADVAGIQQIFALEAYLGVGLILAIGVALTVAALLLVQDSDGVWGFALTVGLLNALGSLVSRIPGLPLMRSTEISAAWFRSTTLTLGVDALLLAALAGWVLIARRFPNATEVPVTSARERASHPPEDSPIPRPRRSGVHAK